MNGYQPDTLIIGSWIVFVLYWIVSALSAKPVAERQSRTSMVTQRVPIGLGAILLFVPNATPFHSAVFGDAGDLGIIGSILVVLGLCGVIWSRKVLADNWSSDVEFKQGHKLVERGPYRFVRHPIYSHLLIMFLGTALASNRIGAFAGVLFFLAGVLIKLKQEERLLLRHFPNEYSAYQRRTKMIVPLVF